MIIQIEKGSLRSTNTPMRGADAFEECAYAEEQVGAMGATGPPRYSRLA